MPLMDQPGLAGVILQLRPLLGSVSVKLTPKAVPFPMLLRVTSNPMASPAETGPAGFAAFCPLRSGVRTVLVSDAELLPVLGSVVLLVTVTELVCVPPEVEAGTV